MNRGKIIFSLFIVVFNVLTGCFNGIETKEDFIAVQKRTGNGQHFEEFKRITDRKKVLKVKEIINDPKWIYRVGDMRELPYYHLFSSLMTLK